MIQGEQLFSIDAEDVSIWEQVMQIGNTLGLQGKTLTGLKVKAVKENPYPPVTFTPNKYYPSHPKTTLLLTASYTEDEEF